jgi:hypothetical protein
MPSIFVTNQKRIYTFYAIAISVLGLYAFQVSREKQRQYIRYFEMLDVSKKANDGMVRNSWHFIKEIYKTSDAYRNDYNENIRKKAEYIENSIKNANKITQNEIETAILFLQSEVNYMPFLKDILETSTQQSAFIQENQTFVDSLFLLCIKDEKTTTTLDAIFAFRKNMDLQAILNSKRNDQKAIMISAINLSNAAAACKVANYLDSKIHIEDFPNFDALMPVLTNSPKCVRVGEIFKGEVFSAPYQNKVHSNVTCEVNGKTLPIVGGFGKFQEEYTTSGKKKLEVKFLVRNPLTQQIKNYTREFQIQICD